MAVEFETLLTLVENDYQNEWNTGGFFNIDFAFRINNDWIAALRGQYHAFNKGNPILDVGISLGKKF